MIISTWSDKGGTGKTTLSTSVACCLTAVPLKLFDFDAQGDAARWAARRGLVCEVVPETQIRAFLKTHANGQDLVVADLPPGSPGVPVAALSDLCILPTRPGDADLVALGRALKILHMAKKSGNQDLKISVVLTQARVGTVRSETVEEALQDMAKREGFTFLGRLSHRVSVEAAAVGGLDLLHCGDASVAHEFRGIISGIQGLLKS